MNAIIFSILALIVLYAIQVGKSEAIQEILNTLYRALPIIILTLIIGIILYLNTN